MPLPRRLVLATLALALYSCGPAPPRATPPLWVARDTDTTIYLFASVHVLKDQPRWFDGAVRAAFDASDTLILEIPPPDPAELAALAERAGASDGRALAPRLPPGARAKLNALPDAASFADVDPWFAATRLGAAALAQAGYRADRGVEAVLASAAQASGKRIAALETADAQFALFDTLPEHTQVAMLTATLDDRAQAGARMDALVADWARGDTAALASAVAGGVDRDATARRMLITDRNARWSRWIARRMDRPGTLFIAVGAGHLTGRDSVIAMLARRGVAAGRVKPAP